MRSAISRSINRALSPLRLEVRGISLQRSAQEQLRRTLAHFRIDTIIDVGANTGQYAKALFDDGFAGHVYSIEPLPQAHAELSRAARRYSRWHVLPPFAAGDRVATVEMQVAGNSVSSSVLPMLERHRVAAPGSAPIDVVTVSQRPLDDVAPSLEGLSAMLKVDTQGYEPMVLAGASRVLQQVRLVQLELSLQPLYEGQWLWQAVIESMQERGFAVWSLHPEFFDAESAQLLQVNALFSKA